MSARPSPEQQKAIDCVGNVVVTARPGRGKTFTLARMIARESKELLSYQGIIAISYTNKASDELEDRCKRLGVERGRSFFGTIDSFCVGQVIAPFMTHVTGHAVDLDLIENKECEEWAALDGRDPQDDQLRGFIKKRLEDGRIPLGALGPVALYILETVPQARIFLSSRFTSIFVDEYQDCGIYQHLLMKRLVSYGLRGIAVGDIDQAIFRFADKSPIFLIELMKDASFSHFQITENRRCDNAIQAYSLALLGLTVSPIDRANRRVFAIHMQGDETDLAHGIAKTLNLIMKKYGVDNFNKVAIIGSGNKTLDSYSATIGIPNKRFGDTPLDHGFTRWRRLLSDLLTYYYDPSRYSGRFIDRHIGTEINPRRRIQGIELIEEFFSLGEDELTNHIELARRIAELCEPKAERDGDLDAYRKTIEDVNTLRGIFRPAQQNEVNILTYHKAKGLEFDIAFCLEAYRYIMPPFRYEEQTYDAYGQSLAMHYVGITRARKVCYIMLGTSRHNKEGFVKIAEPSPFLSLPGLADLRIDSRWS